MSNTITRRTALAASVTLPLLPVTAYATPADPAVEAYREWRAAYDASIDSGVDNDTPEGQVLSNREWAATCPVRCRRHHACRAGLSGAFCLWRVRKSGEGREYRQPGRFRIHQLGR
jgi:hypothetical protein